MAAQTTEVTEENGMDLEAASAVETLHYTTTGAFATNRDNASENEQITLEVESTLTAKDTEILKMTTSDVTVNVDANFKDSSSFEKKCTMEEMLSDADTEENCAVGNNNGGKEGNIGSSPSFGSGYDYDKIPEWKKELLQRRKTKIARTIGANQVNSMCTKKDSNPTSPVTPLTKTLTSNNSSKNSSHQITSKLLPTSIETLTHQTTNGAARTHLSCSTGHYTTINSLQSHTHQPQQICGIENLTTSTSLETKSTSSSSQSLSALTTSSNSTLKNDGFNGSSSDLNNQSFTAYTENNFKCSSSINGNSNSSGGTCQITSQSKQQENQFEQPDSTLNTSSSQEQLQQPFQLHSKHDIVKSSLSSTASCNTAVSPPAICVLSSATINNSNTSFVKNPSVGKTSLNKANKYKLSAKLNLPSSNGSVVTSSQTKKMVAMQQMDINDTSVNLDFDPSEELQYGPGIVSKLRCRYLSLALRQSAGKQRPPLDNLRRATSLNNLLDDDDDSNNGSVVDHVDHAENNSRNNINTCSTLATTPDEFVASFQKNLKMSDKDKQRSRQLKRGNDSLKRARSVEALLGCDKSWDHVNNINDNNSGEKAQTKQLYHKIDGTNNAHDFCSINSAADVTIEDKINHARERILCEKTPKRLTSIIDDTERPPPDVVKQTLKIFEATANRRGRGLSRNNCSGEVAAKVASYKSIICQEKPPVMFPKPPLSPKRQIKKPNSLDIASGKRNVTPNNSTNTTTKKINATSPISNLAKKFTNLDAFNEPCEKNSLAHASQHNYQQGGGTSSGGHRADVTLRHRHNFMAKNESTPIRSSFDNNSNSNSPSRTPDLIPRKHFENSLFSESLSPVTQLAKNIEKLRLESPPLPMQSSVTQSNTTSSMATGSLIPPQRQYSEPSDSSDVSDVEELIKQVSKPTLLKCNLQKDEKNKENNLSSSSSSKLSLLTAVNGNSSATTSSCSLVEQHQGQQGHQQQQQQQQQQIQHQQAIPTKQVCVIRPLLAESSKLSQQIEKSNSFDKSEKSEKSDLSATDALNANKTRDNLVISNIDQSGSCNTLINSNTPSEQSQYQRPALTSREIEKNLINEKKTEQAAIEASTCGAKWPFIKKKSSWNQQMAEAQNNSMVFNFKDRKEVPDYIENDGLFVKRRRELPKANEPGFVLLGDLSLETSTDPDDAWTMGPPSPCDVEFENANIIIDGKSSIRYKTKDINLKVQFDDTLTSTFEYPSESSLLEDNTTFETDTTEKATTTATMQNTKIDELLKAPGQKLLGNMSLGSAPLGSYTPIKAQINATFELGVTRAPITNDGCATQNTNNTNGNQDMKKINNENNLSVLNKNGDIPNSEQESLPYLKPATDDLTIVYSEGSQKTDLLY